jgi:hypothetical protein
VVEFTHQPLFVRVGQTATGLSRNVAHGDSILRLP